MNTKRITKLIEFMAALPKSAEKHFNMSAWIKHDATDHSHAFGKDINPKDIKNCGTTACALGWATAIPSFRRAGLRVYRPTTWADIDTNIRNYKTAESFFGLTEQQSYDLFGHQASPLRKARTPKGWAKGASKLLKKWQAA